jgi:NitT/TauT family transport system permease protein
MSALDATRLADDQTARAGGFGGFRGQKFIMAALPAIAFCVLAALGWEWMARSLHSPLVPDLREINEELQRIVFSGDAFRQIGITLQRIAGGFLLAAIAALVFGIASARSRWVTDFIEPALILGLTVPGLVWALLCVIWFGAGITTPVVAIALGVAPALTVSIAQGVRAVNPELVEMTHVFRFSSFARLRYLWIPAITPFLMSGARLGFSLAWKVVVLVEIFGLSNGVGYQLNSTFSSQNVGGMLAWTIAFGITMAIIEYGLFKVIERRLMRWRREAVV